LAVAAAAMQAQLVGQVAAAVAEPQLLLLSMHQLRM
jgi:hypothetical protein